MAELKSGPTVEVVLAAGPTIQVEITGRGPMGPMGPQGVRGEKGETGPKGEQGETGPQGPMGPQGFQGEAGAKGERGLTGTTFTPAVSPEGVLSWTNDGGLPDPAPVNIRGEKGDTGEKGEKGERGEMGYGVPRRGSAGEALVKTSDEDLEVGWYDGFVSREELAPAAFSGSYNDLTDKPAALPANGGNAATAASLVSGGASIAPADALTYPQLWLIHSSGETVAFYVAPNTKIPYVYTGGGEYGADRYYALPDAGGANAYGTWPIGITGNAATATRVVHTLSFSGGSNVTFDGSSDQTVSIPVLPKLIKLGEGAVATVTAKSTGNDGTWNGGTTVVLPESLYNYEEFIINLKGRFSRSANVFQCAFTVPITPDFELNKQNVLFTMHGGTNDYNTFAYLLADNATTIRIGKTASGYDIATFTLYGRK